MKKRKGSSSDERLQTERDGAVNIEKRNVRLKKTSVVGSREQHDDGVGAKSRLNRNFRAGHEDSAKVKRKRKRGDAAEHEDGAEVKSKMREKKNSRSVTEDVEDALEERSDEEYVNEDHGVEAEAKSRLKRKKKKQHNTVIVDTAGAEEKNLDGEDELEEPGNRSTTGTKYVPPHLRQVEKGSEARIRLERRIRGW